MIQVAKKKKKKKIKKPEDAIPEDSAAIDPLPEADTAETHPPQKVVPSKRPKTHIIQSDLKNRRKHERHNVLSLTRLEGTLKTETAGSVGIRVFTANDVSLSGMGVYLYDAIPERTLGVLEIGNPIKFRIHVKVIWCRNTYASKIISSNTYTYRAGIKFLPENDFDKNQISNLIFFLINRFND